MGILRDKKALSSLATAPCAHLRTAYHNCFNKWYSSFLKSEWNKQDCVLEWEKYRECLSRHLDDKHLRRLLEADLGLNPGAKFESSTGGS